MGPISHLRKALVESLPRPLEASAAFHPPPFLQPGGARGSRARVQMRAAHAGRTSLAFRGWLRGVPGAAPDRGKRAGGAGPPSMGDVEAEGPPQPAKCPGMCPAAEYARRKRQGRLHRLELGPPPGRLPDPARAVKEYSRPAAGQPLPQPADLRPPAVLLATVRHLLGAAAEASEVAPAERCAFVADRLRAVRLDLALQRPPAEPCAALLERSLVFLLHAGAHLGAEPPARFDAHLHRAQLQETFAALRRAYRRPGAGAAPTQPRFQALFLLYNLGSPEVLWLILQLSKEVRASPELVTALAINWAFLERNFARFFRLARELPYLASCALHPHLAQARGLALLTFSHGFSVRNSCYPLAQLANLLATDSLKDAIDLCQTHSLAVTDDNVIFQKGSWKEPAAPDNKRSHLLVDGKKEGSLLELAESVCS